MSANNQVLIKQMSPNEFEVADQDVETGAQRSIGHAETLEVAVKLANQYQEEATVEYGLKIELEK